nr:topless-related protein 3-like [Populus alba]
MAEIVDPGDCGLVTLPDSTGTSSKVVRLLYTNSGSGMLAPGANGIQKLCKWPHDEQNPSGKVICGKTSLLISKVI